MSEFIEGAERSQSVLFPERLEDWISEDNPVRAVDAFVDELDLSALGFNGAQPAVTGFDDPSYDPRTRLPSSIAARRRVPAPSTAPFGMRA